MAVASGESRGLVRLYYRTISFGLTLGLLAVAIFLASELMWQTFASTTTWSAEAFAIQSIVIFIIIALAAGALYAVIMWFKSDIGHLLIGDIIAGGAMGTVTYLLLLASTIAYGDTMIHLGFDGVYPAGLSYAAATLLVPLVTMALTGAIMASVGAITCRAVIKKKRPADRDLRNAALGVIGLIVLIVVVPPLMALVLSGI
ncbi:MAG: hypothetical protein WBZ29_15935 [Methanocella sp.]